MFNIVSRYHFKKQKILFLGPSNILKYKTSKVNFSDILNETPHNYLIQSLWVRGLLFNFKFVIKNLNIKLENLNLLSLDVEKSKFLKKFNGIIKMKQLPKLIVILDDFLINEILIEAAKLKIPLICFLDGNSFYNQINYKVCGKFFNSKFMFFENFICRMLFNILK